MSRHVAIATLGLLVAASAPLTRPAAAAPAAPGAPGTSATSAADTKLSPALQDAKAKLDATDYDAAEAALRAVRGADQAEATLLLARLQLERGRYEDAEKTAAGVSGGEGPRARAAATRAEALFARGKVADAVKALEAVKNAKGAEGRRARVLLGEYYIYQGRRGDADDPLHKVIDDYEDMPANDAEGLSQVGRAAYLLRSAKDANKAYGESDRAQKGNVRNLLQWAELFLDKYDAGHAEEVTREALKVAPKNAEALLWMARIKLDQALDFDAAERFIGEALAQNPRLAAAYAVRAGIALRDMELEKAERAVEQGLAINPEHLELLSMRAAVRFLSDDRPGFEAQKRLVLQKNATYSRFFSIVGEFAEWEHRYDDIVAMMSEAVKLDPEDSRAWAQLGLTTMRNGQEDEGLKALQTAWKRDRFNVMVYNTLNLYEKTIPVDYEQKTFGPFKIRFPKSERPVLERYVPRLAGEAVASMKARYGFVPTLPVHVELYQNREHFSVRTSGLPNIGIQGVCFGRVVAAMSPQSESFNWGNVLWHELGHVFAIQLSKNHVPRWFTEGLSEYETIARRPEWNRELDPQLYNALMQRTLPSAVDMNRAFTHASDGLDVTVAYYASSQMLVYTVERFGMGRVVNALKLWGEGKRTPEVIEKAFGVPPAQYDEGFRNWALARLARYKNQFVFESKPKSLEDTKARVDKAPNDAAAHADYAHALAFAHKLKEARAEIDKALALDPKQKTAHYLAAKIAMAEKNADAARKHLDDIRAAGADGYSLQMAYAEVATATKDAKLLRYALEAAHRYDPNQSEPLNGLLELAVAQKREGDQLDLLRKLTPLDQHNRRAWRTLLTRLVAKKLWVEAQNVCESTLYVDVESAETHSACATAYDEGGHWERAAFEAESALLSSPNPKLAPALHAQLAKLYGKLGKPADAARHDAAAKVPPPATQPSGDGNGTASDSDDD